MLSGRRDAKHTFCDAEAECSATRETFYDTERALKSLLEHVLVDGGEPEAGVEGVTRMGLLTVFKTVAFVRSAILPARV